MTADAYRNAGSPTTSATAWPSSSCLRWHQLRPGRRIVEGGHRRDGQGIREPYHRPGGLALRLTLIPGISGERQRKLLAASVYPRPSSPPGRLEVRSVIGDKADLYSTATQRDAIEHSLAWASQPGQSIITLADAGYPPALLKSPTTQRPVRPRQS